MNGIPDWIIRYWKELLAGLAVALILAIVSGVIYNLVPLFLKRPPPRLDRISLYEWQFISDGTSVGWLYVQGANIDEGATVLIEDPGGGRVEQPTAPDKRLDNDFYDIEPGKLGYPIHHYRSLLVAPGFRTTGSVLTVWVVNEDGQTSEPLDYALPESPLTLDSDGDSLPDEWERNGYGAGGAGTIDLPALGANPYRPDIFVEIDVMACAGKTTPTDEVWQVITETFAAAPIINPDGGEGIHIVLDTSGSVPCETPIDFPDNALTDATITNFHHLRNGTHGYTRHFDNALRGPIYHYCIWAYRRPNRSSGRGEGQYLAINIIDDAGDTYNVEEIVGPGDDLIVSLERAWPFAHEVRSRAEAFIHELGHNLGQRHNGLDSRSSYNPVYSSVMSYAWNLRAAQKDSFRLEHAIYHPLYYGYAGAREPGGQLPPFVGTHIDYSEGMGRDLTEPPEPGETLYNGVPVTWSAQDQDYDGDTDVPGEDLDGVTTSILIDYANWPNLRYAGPRENGKWDTGNEYP